MAINNATLGGATPAMFGTATGRYSNPWYDPDDQVYSVTLTRRLAESAATTTEIPNRRNAEERLTGPRLIASTDEPMWRMRMADIAEPGFGFWNDPPNDGVAGEVTGQARNTSSENARIFGTGELSGAIVQAIQPTQKPSEDLEDLREDYGLRIEELEGQVSELLEHLEVMDQALRKVTAGTIRFG